MMSRSVKRVSCGSDYSSAYTPFAKRQASRAVRRFKGILPKGMGYKKVFPSWNIFDYKFTSWDKDDDWHVKFKRK